MESSAKFRCINSLELEANHWIEAALFLGRILALGGQPHSEGTIPGEEVDGVVNPGCSQQLGVREGGQGRCGLHAVPCVVRRFKCTN